MVVKKKRRGWEREEKRNSRGFFSPFCHRTKEMKFSGGNMNRKDEKE